jgi:hypothetical protein
VQISSKKYYIWNTDNTKLYVCLAQRLSFQFCALAFLIVWMLNLSLVLDIEGFNLSPKSVKVCFFIFQIIVPHGEPVTIDTFLAWRERFEAELALERAK